MHVDHVGLSVGDLDAQAAWYGRALGFETAHPFEIDAVGLRGVFLLGPDGVAIELLEKQGSARVAPPPADPPSALLARGYGHICLRVDDTLAAYERLIAAGAGSVAAPFPAPEPGVHAAFVADPEGNLIELLDRAHEVRA